MQRHQTGVAKPGENDATGQKRLLVIDGDKPWCARLVPAFKDLGVTVDVAHDALRGIGFFVTNPTLYGLILLDGHLPGDISGIDIATYIGSEAVTVWQAPRIVLCTRPDPTGAASLSDVPESCDLLVKPENPEDVPECLANLGWSASGGA